MWGKVFALGQLPHARDIYIDVCPSFSCVKLTANRFKELAYALDFHLFSFVLAKEFLDVLVHDTFRQYLQHEELANETTETQAMTLCLVHSVTSVGAQFRLLSLPVDLFIGFLNDQVFGCLGRSGGSCLLSDPPPLEDFVTAIEQILVLLKTACNGPRAIRGQSESGPKVLVQLAV